MRLPDAVRVLWMDALCINQKDIHEKSQQVRMMPQIYSSGQANLIHFTENPELAAPTLVNIIRIWVQINSLVSFEVEVADIYTGLLQTIDVHDPSGTWRRIVRPSEQWLPVVNHTWYSRLWVLQETILAKCNILHWGASSIDFDAILGLAATATHAHSDMVSNRNLLKASAMSIYRSLRSGHYETSGIGLMVVEQLRCADVRDKVYGFAACLNDKNLSWDLLKPDYTKPASVVLRDGMRTCMYNTSLKQPGRPDGDLHVLMSSDGLWASQSVYPELKGAPSWVTQWYGDYDRTPPMGDRVRPPMEMPPGSACGRILFSTQSDVFRPGQDLDILALEGLTIGTVAQTSSTLLLHFLVPDQRPVAVDLWLNEVFNMKSKARVSASNSTIAMVLIAGGGHLHLSDDNWGQMSKRHAHSGLVALRSQHREPGLERKTEKYSERLMDHCDRRCVFVTNKHIGLGPPRMTAGDTIVVFSSGKNPFVIRERPGEPGYYTFIGHCYMSGTMNGEAVREYESVGKLPEVFKLR